MQFGVFRAIGMSFGSIISMLAVEQLLLSVVAVIVGVLIGSAASEIFVPLLALNNSAADQIPPMRITAFTDDYAKVYIIVGIMLLIGFTMLAVMISKIKIATAIKLGEE